MKYYKSYMDRQTVGDDFHRRLLETAGMPAAKPRRYTWQAAAALAACCVLIAALTLGRPGATPPVGPVDVGPGVADPVEDGDDGPENNAPADSGLIDSENIAPTQPDYSIEHDYQFLAESGQDEGTRCLPCIQRIDYQPVDGILSADYAMRLMVPDGAFEVPLTEEQICLILWGGDQATYDSVRAQGGNVPWLLGWDGYSLSGKACYDGEGDLYTVYIWGVWAGIVDAFVGSGRSFTVTLAPGDIPPSCIASQGAVTDSRGVAVEGWSYHLDQEYIYECAFLAHDVGTRFSFQTGEEDNWTELLFVNWCTYADGGLSLDHLLRNEDIPAWERYEVSGLAEAREVERFAPYLPLTAPEGFTEDFYGLVDYQEGVRDQLYLRWSKGYDDVSIRVERPEGGQDPYQDHPTVFQVADWSFAAQEAHKYPHDTGGWLYDFKLLYPDGTLATYRCAGMTAQQVWDLVAPTLP